MYDTVFPWEPFELVDPMADILSDLDMLYGCYLDPDKPSGDDLVEVTEQGFDSWLMGLAGVL